MPTSTQSTQLRITCKSMPHTLVNVFLPEPRTFDPFSNEPGITVSCLSISRLCPITEFPVGFTQDGMEVEPTERHEYEVPRRTSATFFCAKLNLYQVAPHPSLYPRKVWRTSLRLIKHLSFSRPLLPRNHGYHSSTLQRAFSKARALVRHRDNVQRCLLFIS